MRELSRRQFLKGVGATTALAWAGPLLVPRRGGASETLDPPPFEYGVASGDPLADRVILWTRLTPDAGQSSIPVGWEISTNSDFSPDATAAGTASADLANDYTVKVDAGSVGSPLLPGTTHYYRFHALGATSRTGRTRTAPVGDVGSIAFAVASCQDFQTGYYASWREIAARDLDFVLHVGDYIYEYADDGDGFRPHVPAHEIVSLADYRARYANYRSDPDLRAAHRMHPFIVVWDDHEVANDRWREGAENHQASEGDYLARRDRAYQAFAEWIPIRTRPAVEPLDPAIGRIYRTLSYGNLAELFMLDSRTYRDSIAGGFLTPNVDSRINDASRTLLGATQKAELKGWLSSSPARWRLIGNQVMMAHLDYAKFPDQLAQPLAQLLGIPRDGISANADQWDGYQPERREILGHIRDNASGKVAVFTGDLHTSWAMELYVNAGNAPLEQPVAAEFVGPSITSINLNELTMTPPRTLSVALEQYAKVANPHIKYAETDSHGYMTIEVTPARVVGRWWFSSDIRDAEATEHLAASFETLHGDAHMVDASGSLLPPL